jgi:NADH-quinone oxidoreductase subunit E/NADP-reducing hydrogenase subunit HndA
MAIKPETKKEIAAICEQYQDEPSPLLLILEDVQKKFGYIPLEVQEFISSETGVPVSEIYGVVTFYNFFSLDPKGKYVINVCLGTACYVKNNQSVIEKFESLLNIQPGQTTQDGLFTIEAIRCMGACALAPAVAVNGKVFPQMTVDKVSGIIDEYKKLEANA